MKGLASLDYAVIILYLLATGIVGGSFYRRRSTAREYFLGGRSMSWLPVGISIIAADLSAITVMGTPAWAYSHNLELLWNTAGYVLVAPIVIIVFAPVVVIGLAFYALLLGAAAAGICEAVEERTLSDD